MPPTAIPKTRKIVDLLANGEQWWGPLDAVTYESLKYEIFANDGKLTLQPVILSVRGRLLDGHHRLMIAQEYGRKVITENEWRVDTNAVDAETEALAAIGYQRNRRQTTSADNAVMARRLMRQFSWSQGNVAKKLHVSAAAVSQWLSAHPDPDFEVTSRVGLDGKTYTVDPDDESPPKAKTIRRPAKAGQQVVNTSNKYRAEITNPEFAGWLDANAADDERVELAMIWRAVSEAAARIAESLEATSPTGSTPF